MKFNFGKKQSADNDEAKKKLLGSKLGSLLNDSDDKLSSCCTHCGTALNQLESFVYGRSCDKCFRRNLVKERESFFRNSFLFALVFVIMLVLVGFLGNRDGTRTAANVIKLFMVTAFCYVIPYSLIKSYFPRWTQSQRIFRTMLFSTVGYFALSLLASLFTLDWSNFGNFNIKADNDKTFTAMVILIAAAFAVVVYLYYKKLDHKFHLSKTYEMKAASDEYRDYLAQFAADKAEAQNAEGEHTQPKGETKQPFTFGVYGNQTQSASVVAPLHASSEAAPRLSVDMIRKVRDGGGQNAAKALIDSLAANKAASEKESVLKNDDSGNFAPDSGRSAVGSSAQNQDGAHKNESSPVQKSSAATLSGTDDAQTLDNNTQSAAPQKPKKGGGAGDFYSI